jgi:hypothetical protein
MADQTPDFAQHLDTAQNHHRSGRLSEAEAAYLAALQVAPASVDVLRLLGALYLQRGAAQSAIPYLTRALSIDPNQHEARLNLGRALISVQRYGEACAELAHALRVQPDNIDTLINYGNALHKLGRTDEAIAAYRRAIILEPGHALAQFSLGRAFAAEGRPHDALEHYDQALAAQANYAEARWAKGVTKLMLGEYLDGWTLYEARWQSPSFGHSPRQFPRPMWDGGGISGKTLLVHAEQGFGDTIQFCRYIQLLTAQGVRVLLLAQPELRSLLQASLSCDVFSPGEPIPKFDVHCALLSLPHLMRTTLETVPHTTPYLTPPSDKITRWENLLGPKQKVRVGLAWSGRRTHIDDQRRSMTLEALRSILELGAEFHALQTEISAADQEALSQSNIRTFDVKNRDFGDAAAHVAAMDVVVSVDTSLAHLAGGLGKRTWIMLAHKPDFRWMLNREDSPWYPTAQLFRQTQKSNWDDVIARVRSELQKLL